MFIHFPSLTKLLSIIIPVKAITLWPFIFTSNPTNELSKATKNHELIHLAQQQEVLLLILFILILASLANMQLWPFIVLLFSAYYIIYGIFYFIKFIFSKEKILKIRSEEAYFKIPFEVEAHENQYDFNYLSNRKSFAWIRYIKS